MPSAFLHQAEAFASSGEKGKLTALIDEAMESIQHSRPDAPTKSDWNAAVELERAIQDRRAS